MISRSDVSVDTVVVRDPPATSFTVVDPGGEGGMPYLHAWPGVIIGGLLLVAFAVGPDRYAARASPLCLFSRHDSGLWS